jgi:hypothetical protein
MNTPVFQLPFVGEWLTFWGGDIKELNHHHDAQAQRHAFDFIQTDSEGKFFKSTGKMNEDYYSFGRDVLAPADGVVVEVVDGMRDNPPGQLSHLNALGNYVVIDHGNNTYSFLAHLRQYSTVVKQGQSIQPGSKLANVATPATPPTHTYTSMFKIRWYSPHSTKTTAE